MESRRTEGPDIASPEVSPGHTPPSMPPDDVEPPTEPLALQTPDGRKSGSFPG